MSDPVESAVAAYLDYLEGDGSRPTFVDLSDDDRRRAVGVINLLLAGRGADLNGDASPFEELLCGTEPSSSAGCHPKAPLEWDSSVTSSGVSWLHNIRTVRAGDSQSRITSIFAQPPPRLAKHEQTGRR